MSITTSRRIPTQVVLGAAVLLVGLLLLADTTGLYDTGTLVRFVPSLFVLVGLYALVRSGFRNLFGPLMVVLVAGAWQLVALEYVTAEAALSYWPVVLIALGLSLALGRRRRVEAVGADADLFALFGASERRVNGPFERASLTALFGGVELDLRDADPVERPARVDATALFGGVEVIVPREWNVVVDVLPVLAGAEDERPRREGEHETVDLIVSGFAAFGGVSVSD